MSLKFSFGSSAPSDHGHDDGHGHDGHGHGAAVPGIPLPFAGASSRSMSSSSVLEMRVTLSGDEVVCDGLSGDGVSYARASRRVADRSAAELALGVRSAIARAGAALPEPLIDSVTVIVLDLNGAEEAALAVLGLSVSAGADQLATVDSALQARVGVPAGTPIRRA